MNITEKTAYECGQCKKTYMDKTMAEDCCKPYKCEDCGTETPRYRLRCEPCALKRTFEKAEKLTEWNGWVYWDGLGYNDGYFSSANELIEYCEDEGIEIPDWVFVCKLTKHELDIDHAIEQMLEEAYEDAENDLNDVDELREFVEQWNKKQNIVSYYPDYKKVLILKK